MNILSLSSLIPEQICDTVRYFCERGNIFVSHYCQYASDFASEAFESLKYDGAVFPKSCDSCRVLGSYLEGSDKFIYQLHVPARRDSGATTYFAESLRQYQQAVETHYRIKITDIAERVQLVNLRNQRLAGIYERLPEISYSAYLEMLHTMLQMPLREQSVSDTLPMPDNPGGHRVFVIGSTLSDTGLVRKIENAGLNIVGDRLPESRRLFSMPAVSQNGDIFENIAASILSAYTSPTQNNFSEILQEDRMELIRKGIEGVIYVTQKYCEPYDYLFPAYKMMLDELGIKCLRLTSTGSETAGAELAIETFADML